MAIELGGVVTRTCDDIADGIPIGFFDLHCANMLQYADPGNALEGHVPLASQKSTYTAFELARQVTVCDQDDFAKEGFPLTMRVKLSPKCPFASGNINYRVDVDYGEATNPVNGINSPVRQTTSIWTEGSSTQNTYATDAITTPWAGTYSSDGIGQCTIKLEQIDADPLNTCQPTTVRVTATLVKLGRPYDFLSSQPEVQTHNVACEAFVAGQVVTGFWTGLAFPSGPIGLVMTLSYSVRRV